jgi:hypothetical protein
MIISVTVALLTQMRVVYIQAVRPFSASASAQNKQTVRNIPFLSTLYLCKILNTKTTIIKLIVDRFHALFPFPRLL